MIRGDANAMRRRLLLSCAVILACVIFSTAPAIAQSIESARDLARSAGDAARARVPLLLFFSQPDCPYCEQARREYLGPMNAAPAPRVRMVEIDISSDAALIDFAGLRTTHRAFAAAQRVRFVPVVDFVDARGRPIANRLIGLTVPDFYQSYLDQRIEQAQARLTGR